MRRSQESGLALLFALSAICLSAQLASAAPIILGKANKVADLRCDPGTGLCGSAAHFQPVAPLTMLSEAQSLLDKPAGDSALQARSAGLVPSVNLRNADPAAQGDFTLPDFPDALLPFSKDSAAMPPGDDLNVAVRLSGYLNAMSTGAGQAVTFALSCDDACSLALGGQTVIALADGTSGGCVTRQVSFSEGGLYSVEIVYFQNSGPGLLELSRAMTAEPEGMQPRPLDPAKFQPIATTDLYSAITGQSSSCQECAASDASCPGGNFCADGLCQVCNVSEHCGPLCQTCPASARICNAGKCVSCTRDDTCPPGQSCVNGQ